MGTNYYLMHRKPVCKCCGHKKEPLHIGKSSYGWCFALHVEPEDPDFPQDIYGWEVLFNSDKYYIEDEYGEVITVEEMLGEIKNRSHPRTIIDIWPAQVLSRNSAEHGPNNLVRHKVDGRHCVGHGEGTWDYITGEFS